MRRRSRASALVEFVFLAPVLLSLFLGLVGVGVEVWAQLGLVAVAQEAAHAAAVAPNAAVAVDQGTTRGYEVGSGYRLGNGTLRVAVDARQFGPGGRVGATATYRLGRTEIPLLTGFEFVARAGPCRTGLPVPQLSGGRDDAMNVTLFVLLLPFMFGVLGLTPDGGQIS